MRFPVAAAVASITLAPCLSAAADNIRILPDQAILACQAKAEHELSKRAGEVIAIKRYDADAMENFMFRVKGLFSAKLGEREEVVEVECEVSSSQGVEVFTMLVGMDE